MIEGLKKDVFNPLEIKGDKSVTLRSLTSGDSGELFTLIENNRVFFSQYRDRYAVKNQTLRETEKNILFPESRDKLDFGIRNEHGNLVGTISLTPSSTYENKAGISFHLGREFTHKFLGKDYMGEAMELVIHYVFKHTKLTELTSEIFNENSPAGKVLERSGFSKIGDIGENTIYGLLKSQN